MVLVAVAMTGCTDELELGTARSDLDLSAFVLPPAASTDRAAIVHDYDLLDPGDEIPRGLLEDAIVYFDLNQARIPKTKYFVVIDFSRHSKLDRFWLVDMTTGFVEPHKVAHGDGSDPDNNGTATLFGNVEGSHKSSLGFYLTGEIYNGTHAHSMRLDGLSRDGSPNGMANSNARQRLIVMHEASYVDDDSTTQQGRSNGCPALDPAAQVAMADRIHDGTLMYAAISPLHPPVGRGPGTDTDPPADDPGEDVGEEVEEPVVDEAGGCSTSGGGVSFSFAVAFAFAGLRRRRR